MAARRWQLDQRVTTIGVKETGTFGYETTNCLKITVNLNGTRSVPATLRQVGTVKLAPVV